MRSEEKIVEMMWLLDGDPDSDELNQVLFEHSDSRPKEADVKEYLRLVDDAMIYNKVEGLGLAIKKLEIILWLLEDAELLQKVHAIPFEGYESLIEKGLIIKDGLSFEEEE